MFVDSERPNIIVIILDAVRAKSISAYGCSKGTTPYLDTFAAHNVLFSRTFSAGTWTIPTHASILTGLYRFQHRIESTKADRCFNDAILSLPTALQSHGYRTVAFSQNFLFSPKYQLGGFQEFYDMEAVWKTHPMLRAALGISLGTGEVQNSALQSYVRKLTGLRRFLDAMFNWIKACHTTTPFFLMANIANVHYPWAPPPGSLLRAVGYNLKLFRNRELFAPKPFQFNSGKLRVTEMHRRVWHALYHAAIRHVDREIGRFLRQLSRWRGWANTIVVLTADHGEMLGDYRDIFGHMLSLHSNLLHVPLIIRHPDYSGGIIAERVVQNLDIFSSVVEWTGCPTSSIATAQLQRPGFSVAMETPHDRSGVAFAEEDYTDSYNPLPGLRRVNPKMDPKRYPRRQVAICSANYKLIWTEDGPGEFYDLRSDPDETLNIIDKATDDSQAAIRELRQRLGTWLAGLETFPPKSIGDATSIDPVTLERLRDLGYLE
jgi:arylsulfatase A-like enzyme